MNNIVFTKSTSSCRTKAAFDQCDKIVNDPKFVGNLMNKNFLNIADKLLKEKRCY